LFFANTCVATEPIERLTFSPQEFQHFGIGAEPEAQEMGLSAILCRLFAISDPTLTDHTGALDCREFEQYVVLTDISRLDLNQDGTPDFVALVNDPSLASPNSIMVVYSLNAGWAAQLIHTYRAEIEETVIDVNRDGWHEICAKSIIGHFGILEQDWVDVYVWAGEMYVERNAQFLESFYRQRYLPHLAGRIDEAREMLIHEVPRETILTMLQDTRTALQRIITLSKAREKAPSVSLNQSHTFSYKLEGLERRLGEIQSLSQQEGTQEMISSILEKTRDDLLGCSELSNSEME
jgi:hypothetical protein